MKQKIQFLLVLIFILPGFLFAQNWRELKTADDVCKAYPEKIKTMLDQFNLNYPGLEKTKQYYNSGNIEQASLALLDYYKNGNAQSFLRKKQPTVSAKTDALADTILKNVFVVQNVRGQVPWLPDGHRDWYYKGPNNDREWAWLSNRHSQINHVFDVYFETGNPKYVDYIDAFLRDFITASMPYPAKKSSESIWRGLEVAARVKVWSRIFYGLLNNNHFNDATRLLLLSSLPYHAHYNRQFHAQNNWLTMEISALATAAANWPEYEKSPEWLAYAAKTISESMKEQVYPDGVQTELTAHYHNVALANFVLFKEICDRANYPLPPYFGQTIEKMYNYTAKNIRPDGNRPLNNDADKGSNVPMILKGAQTFQKPEWKYIATNGAEGVKPADGPSYFFPWAGQLISRSGFDKNAQWSFFDVGPWGSGHQHNDRLHISVSAYGRDLLVDAGRFAYTGAVAQKFRAYAKGTQGHNALLIDGKGQKPGVRVAENPLSEKHWRITPDYDYAWNSFDDYYDIKDVKHNRTVMYVRSEFWIVIDNIETKNPRTIETLWHWHPACKVEQQIGNVVSTINEHGNLKVVPIGNTDWNIDFVKGQEQPEIQGWYSKEYNEFEPNVASIYSTKIEKESTFVWLLLPYEKEAPQGKVELISKNINEIKLNISNAQKGTWKLTIPYSDSKKAALEFTK